jgi:hypothetical protein
MEHTTPDLIGGAAGPCLVIREDDVVSIQKKINEYDWAAQAFASLETKAKAWIAQAIDIPERGGQWPHWYACEDCGAKLATVSPTEHRCPSCDRVYSGEPWDSVPLTDMHNGLSQAVLSLGVYFALSGDKDAANKVAEILLGYAERYPRYEIRDHNLASDTPWATKVSWGTLGESVWLIPICGGYDLIRDAGVLSPADHQTIREQLLRPAARLILKHDIGIHNIQCWHNAAIGSAGLMLRDRDLVGFAVDGDVGIRAQIRKGVLNDGFWHEGSWGYHFYGMRPLLAWMEALRNCGLDLYNDQMKRMFEAPLLAVLPDGSLPSFHDSGGPHISATAPHYEIGFARYRDDRFAGPLLEDTRDNLNALLYGATTLPKDTSEVNRSTHLRRAGFVYLRQGDPEDASYMALDYGPHGGGHGHPDKLSFVLYGAGQVMAPDPGSVAYGIPIQQKWYKQTVSHNTLVVDGQSQMPSTGQLEALVRGRNFDLVRISADEAYDGVRMSRTLLFIDGTVLMVDRLTGEQHHTFDWVYHNRGRLRTGFARKRSSASIGERDGYEVIQDVRAGMPEGTWRATWRTEDAGMRLTMLGSRQATEVISGLGLDNGGNGLGAPGEMQTPMVIARRRVRRRTTFNSVLQTFRDRPMAEQIEAAEVSPARRARGVTLTRGRVKRTLISAYLPGAVTWEDIEFEGKSLFVEMGSRTRVVLADGTRLTWEGRTWILSRPGSIQVEFVKNGIRTTSLSEIDVEVEVEGRVVVLNPGQRWVVRFE